MVTKEQITRAKQVDFLELIERMEIPYKQESGHVKVNCLFHEERTASLAIYDDHYYCYSCSENGDIIDFIKHLYEISFENAVRHLNKIHG